MPHPLVTQLRFARHEFERCLDGVSPEDAVKRLEPMNCISWIIGHMANQEQYYWVILGQDKIVKQSLNGLVGFGQPATSPPLHDMWSTWYQITAAADAFLNTITSETLDVRPSFEDKQLGESYGTLLLRNIYHYWFHIGEAHAIRQSLGHGDLPQFVGDMKSVAY